MILYHTTYWLLTDLLDLDYAVADMAIAVECLNLQFYSGILKSVINHLSSPYKHQFSRSRSSEVSQLCPCASSRVSKSNSEVVYRSTSSVGQKCL